MSKIRIILIDTNEVEETQIAESLCNSGFVIDFQKAQSLAHLFDLVRDKPYDLIIGCYRGDLAQITGSPLSLLGVRTNLPVLMLVQDFTAEIVNKFQNSHIQRVLPISAISTLIPETISAMVGFQFMTRNRLGNQSAQNHVQNEPYQLKRPFQSPGINPWEMVESFSMLDAVGVFMMVLDPNDHILGFNQAMQHLIGVPFEQIKGRSVIDLYFISADRERFFSWFGGDPSVPYPNHFQVNYRANSRTVHVDWTVVTITNPDGTPAFKVATGIDVTDLVEYNLSFNTLLNQFRIIFQDSPLGILLISPVDLEVLDVNASAAKIFNDEIDSITGRSLIDLGISMGDCDFEQLIQKAGTTRQPIQISGEVMMNSGQQRDIEMSFAQIVVGPTISILILIQDLTELKNAERANQRLNAELETRFDQRTSELESANTELSAEIKKRKRLEEMQNQLTQILSETPDVVAMTDLQGNIFYLNRAGQDLFNIHDDLTAHNAFEVYPPDQQEFILNVIVPIVLSEGLWKGELSMVNANGRSMPVSQVILGHRNEEGDVEFISSIAVDISDQRAAQKELENVIAQERELSELRARFIENASHEFRTPLSAIISSAELILRFVDSWNSERKISHVNRILTSANRINHTLQGLLEIDQISTGRDELSLEQVDLVHFAAEMEEDFNLIEESPTRVKFITDLKQCNAWLDPYLLLQTLTNLLSNAVKFSRPETEVLLKLELEGQETCVFIIQDKGIGIPAKDIPFIYNPFQRSDNAREYLGYGLGMVIVKKSVDLMKGKISIESTLNIGTAVRVELPISMNAGEETSGVTPNGFDPRN